MRLKEERLSLVLPAFKRDGLNIVLVSHMEDLDGIASQALVLRAVGEASIFLVDYQYPAYFGSIVKDADVIVVTDLGIDAAHVKVLEKAIPENARVFWIDHHVHPTHGTLERKVVFVHDPRAPSTCALLGREGFVRDRWETMLAHMATLNDKGKSHPMGDHIALAIEHEQGNLDKLLALVRAFAAGIIPGWIWTSAREMRKTVERVTKRLKKNHIKIELEDRSAIIGVVSDISPVRTCKILANIFDTDIYIGIRKDTRKSGLSKVAIFSRKYNVEKLARKFNGGGHEKYAGFYAHTHYRGALSRKFIDKLIRELQKIPLLEGS